MQYLENTSLSALSAAVDAALIANPTFSLIGGINVYLTKDRTGTDDSYEEIKHYVQAIGVAPDAGGGDIGFTPEDVANKSTDIAADTGSDVKYPSVAAVEAALPQIQKTGSITLLNDGVPVDMFPLPFNLMGHGYYALEMFVKATVGGSTPFPVKITPAYGTITFSGLVIECFSVINPPFDNTITFQTMDAAAGADTAGTATEGEFVKITGVIWNANNYPIAIVPTARIDPGSPDNAAIASDGWMRLQRIG